MESLHWLWLAALKTPFLSCIWGVFWSLPLIRFSPNLTCIVESESTRIRSKLTNYEVCPFRGCVSRTPVKTEWFWAACGPTDDSVLGMRYWIMGFTLSAEDIPIRWCLLLVNVFGVVSFFELLVAGVIWHSSWPVFKRAWLSQSAATSEIAKRC